MMEPILGAEKQAARLTNCGADMRRDSEEYVTITVGHVFGAMIALGWVGYHLYMMVQAYQAGRGGEAMGASLGGAIGVMIVLLATCGWFLFQVVGKGKKVQFGNRSTSKSSLPEKVDFSSDQLKDLDL